jgi:hypothetical protein
MVQTSGTALSSGQRAQYAVPASPCRSSLLDVGVASGDATQDWGEARRALCYVGIEEVNAAVEDLGADAVVVAGPLAGNDQCLAGPGPGVY